MRKRTSILAGLILLTAIPALLSAAAVSMPLGGGLQARGLSLAENDRAFILKGLDTGDLTTATNAVRDTFLDGVKSAGGNTVKFDAFPATKETEGKDGGEFLKGLDAAVAAAKGKGLKVLLTLSNSALQARYASKAGSSNPGVFFTDFNCRDAFTSDVKKLLERVNTVTGNLYGREPVIAGWVIADTPANADGNPDDVNRWVAETSALVKGSSPRPIVVLALDPAAKGMDAAKAAAQPGVDLVLLKGDGSQVEAFAASCGRPVAACVTADTLANAKISGVGLLVSWMDPSKVADVVVKQKFASGPASASGDLIASVSVAPGPAPAFVQDGKAVVKAVLKSKGTVTVRYGLKGVLDIETSPASSPSVTLTNLRAGEEYTLQVKVVDASGRASFSDRKTVKIPAVRRLAAKPRSYSGNFIKVSNGRFLDGNKKFRYVGTNNYYLHLSDDKLIDSVFADCVKIGLTVMRTWAFGCTDKEQESWPGEMDRYFVLGPGKYREKTFKDLDRVVASAKKHKVRLILAFVNNWTDYGGAEVWAKYFGYKDKNDFFDKAEVKQAFKDYMKKLVTRVNTVTGVAYKDDPIIMAWDLMNEPRYERDTTGKTLAAWVDEMAKELKSYGVKQMVTTGGEGPLADGKHYSGADFLNVHQSPAIDFATFHVYPSSEWARWNLEATKAVLVDHVKLGHEKLKKPVVMEEYGIGRRDPKYDQPTFVQGMTESFMKADGDGLNYWMLIDPAYQWGDGNEFTINDVGMCNIFTQAANELAGGK